MWSPRQPALHELRLELGQDDWNQRIGLRHITTRDEQLVLNGRPIRLWGVNCHHTRPQTGSAISDQSQMLQTAWQATMQGPRPLAGFAVWQFCDARTSTEPRMMLGRPRGFNNKGIVDDQRVPKLAYDTLQRDYQAMSAAEAGR